ncbi:MAG: hypothetical protein H7228_14425 [Polaromonas sp.]|nr:hypothetical protein [Polaromonas sp.]
MEHLLDKAEQLMVTAWTKVEHLFRAIKCQFGFNKAHCKASAKNTAQLMTPFAPSNLWMACLILVMSDVAQGATGT